MSSQHDIVLISFNRRCLTVIGRVRLANILGSLANLPPDPTRSIEFICPMRFGVNTSTTNKYENKLMVLVGIHNTAA